MFNTLRPRQNGCHFADDVFKCIFLNENVWILLKISLKFVPKGPINIIPSLVQVMAWRRPGDNPLSEPMMVSLLTHICVAWPQSVKSKGISNHYASWLFILKLGQANTKKNINTPHYWSVVRGIHQWPNNHRKLQGYTCISEQWNKVRHILRL